jgi:HTH-type transcriptional regulator / antitoxin HigA
MEIRRIKTAEDHKAALARIDALMEAEAGTPEAAELEVWTILVEKFEQEMFPIKAPSAWTQSGFAWSWTAQRPSN